MGDLRDRSAYVYDCDAEDFIATQADGATSTVADYPMRRHASGTGAEPRRSQRRGDIFNIAPALVLDATDEDLVTLGTCVKNQNFRFLQVPYCVMADWASVSPVADGSSPMPRTNASYWIEDGYRTIALSLEDGTQDTKEMSMSSVPGSREVWMTMTCMPNSDLLTTRERYHFGISSLEIRLDDLGFPYILPVLHRRRLYRRGYRQRRVCGGCLRDDG